MKLNFLIASLFLCTGLIHAQDKLVFNYDTAGNQILRDRICLNCSASKADVARDSIPGDLSDNDPANWLEEKFIASPNPVTDILTIEWISQKDKYISQISIYGSGNKKLYTKKPKTGDNSSELDFTRFPSGFYILLVTYSNGQTQTHKILKK